MNISGIRPTQGFYSYNVVKINQLRNKQIAAAKRLRQEKKENDEQLQVIEHFAS